MAIFLELLAAVSALAWLVDADFLILLFLNLNLLIFAPAAN